MDDSKAIAAIRDARPPATDRFTYLTIVEANLSAAVLPTLNEILQDAELTQEIGWDLVYNLVNLPGSDACLETIARLGNPREVILKVLETLELVSQDDDGYQSDDEGEKPPPTQAAVSLTHKFITLLGILAILHTRIKTKYPSRFLAQTLQTVYRTYRPNQEMTAAVINLVHSLSGRRRPALPSRKSSVNVANPDQDGDTSKNAPDPEADKDQRQDPSEDAMQQRLLLSFVTCVLETYVNGNDMAWAARLLEFYNPGKIIPGKTSVMAAFRENQELLARDAIVGQLVALIKDLGLPSFSRSFLTQLHRGAVHNDPLANSGDILSPDDLALSTGGCACLLAYWVFSSTVFDADQAAPDIHIFPEHFDILEKFLEGDPESEIQQSPGTIEALVAIGLWLQSNNLISSTPSSPLINSTAPSDEEPTSQYMKYIHLATLTALYHPRIQARNAAVALAGQVLHADPADDDRLRILYDLLENCMFASLKACAVTWLREEYLAAAAAAAAAATTTTADPSTTTSKAAATATATASSSNVFAGPQALETVEYVLFPNVKELRQLELNELIDYLAQNSPFLIQAANFGLFLWGSSSKWKHVLPANTDATVKERWFEPLQQTLARLDKARRAGGELEGEDLGPLASDLDVLRDRLALLRGSEGFRAVEEAERA
ncbi:YAP-binding/ALF4/Glomulin [Bombardia bombarda]|uniref:YAP-binding/ALF4/Glomulin n=1 Tax=Bombardia bombarda TaxID=252184 RepID=A0AA39WUB2_9PEZI|nr:YAP-binding/ALF4/Glomulin [Bombardia bombarda]